MVHTHYTYAAKLLAPDAVIKFTDGSMQRLLGVQVEIFPPNPQSFSHPYKALKNNGYKLSPMPNIAISLASIGERN